MQPHISIEEIIQQLRSEDAEPPYLGFFTDDRNEQYWHIEANRAGLRKYAADLLGASIYTLVSENGSLDAPLDSSWLDEEGYAHPHFVKFVEAPNLKQQADYSNTGMNKVWMVGCMAILLVLLGIFVAGIKEISDLLRA